MSLCAQRLAVWWPGPRWSAPAVLPVGAGGEAQDGLPRAAGVHVAVWGPARKCLVRGTCDVCMNVTCVSDEPRHAGRATPVTYWGPGPLGDPLQVAP